MTRVCTRSFLTVFILLVLVGSVAAGAPDGSVVGTDDTMPYIVVLTDQPDRGTTYSMMKAQAAATQASVLSSISAIDSDAAQSAEQFWIVNALRVEADKSTIERIALLPGVDHVEPDMRVQVDDPVFEVSDTVDAQYMRSGDEFMLPWHLDWIETPAVWDAGNMGEGVRISVVDTGIDGTHPAFGERVVGFADFVNGDNTSAYDDNGHGTHCAGTAAGGEVMVSTYDGIQALILGTAPEAELIGAKVLNSAGSGLTSDIIKGIEWSVENDADVISLSVGSYAWDANKQEYFSLAAGETLNLTLEVGGNIASNGGLLEPQFVVGGYALQQEYGYNDAEPANLSMTLYAPNNVTATGGYIDWNGFDQSSDVVKFKAPYASNSGNWNGVWLLQVTNNGNESVMFEGAAIAEARQSDGNTAYDLTLNNLADLGVVAVVAAGNNGDVGTGTIGTPGTAEDVITVGATDYCMDYRASFSSIGPVNRTNPYIKPDLMAPGVGILSAYPNGQYAVMDGTSMATPGVAGTVALMLAGNDTLTPAQVKQTLMQTAVHIKEDGTAMATYEENNLYGAGRISSYLAVEATDGLHGTLPSPYLTELFGGPSYDADTDPNTVTMLGVCWNATAGAPIEGETVEFKVYYNYYNPVFINASGVTDADGRATATIDITSFPVNAYFYTEATWQGRTLSSQKLKPSSEGGGNGYIYVPFFESQSFIAPPDGAITMRYPLLDVDGSAYSDTVQLKVANSTTTFFDETLTPVNGVVEATVDFSKFNINVYGSDLSVTIDGRRAGSVAFAYEVWYEGMSSPKQAICPAGSTIDIALQVAEPHGIGGTITSKDYAVYVTAFTETEILSLPAEVGGALAAGMPVDDAALVEATGGMEPEEIVGTVQVRNGIGVYQFTMPEDCYVAVVKFVDPDEEFYGSYDSYMVSVVYGSMSPWTLHRVTPTVPESVEGLDSTYLVIMDYEWAATWSQGDYHSVPADTASLTASVITVNGTTGEVTDDAGKTVRLYTADGVQTNTTAADGTCTFTLNVSGKASEDVILITDGISSSAWVLDYIQGYPVRFSRIDPGIITGYQQTAAALRCLEPATESRWMEVDYQGSGSYMVSLYSYGPDDTPIVERGVFTASPYFNWKTLGTEFADTLAFTGTWAKNVTPSQNGTYEAHASVLQPDGSLMGVGVSFFDVPGACVSYTVKPDVLVGETVPVTFTVADSDGNPISNAKVGFFLGAAAMDASSTYNDDVRPLNIDHLAMEYPDPYSEVLTGYTDSSGRATLTIHAPSAALREERIMLGFSDNVPYKVVCYDGDEIVKSNSWYYDGTFRLATAALPDFVPSVSAPHVVKLNRDDSVKVNDLYLYITNQGTADFIYTDEEIVVRAAIGDKDQSTTYNGNIPMGETKQALHTNVEAYASDYGINTSDYHLPVDAKVNVTVNPDRTIDEICYANNNIVYPVRITAPDLAAEIIVPPTVVQSGTATPIALVVTNQGEVAAVATTMDYLITGQAVEEIAVPALGVGESYTVWRNKTLLADPGTYTLALEVNPDGVTDYETTFANNRVTKTVHCYLHPTTSIELPTDLVLVPGTTYDLPIVVGGAENLATFAMTFTFDPSAVTVTGVSAGDVGALTVNLNHVDEGYVIFGNCQAESFSGNLTVATVHISVIGSGGDETALGLVDVELFDADEYQIPVEVTDGSAVLLLYGDANGDGSVNQADTLRVLREVVGLESKPTVGTTSFLQTDVHENRAIEVGDAMFIAQKNVGLRDPYFRIV
ncbi:S8 family serine peptidase [Methanofollis fontis]|uniref:Dockerin domain-containing protein n=1 Tax=Methanofollis fontis TaxID=2052832 RepID=A0A483CR69_9EURY|nr:S8 family serine peptidase [Methanofollis fontis]TAJ45308.1 hypothetical protein CUJ86_00745 [Methanofollis fontis]